MITDNTDQEKVLHLISNFTPRKRMANVVASRLKASGIGYKSFEGVISYLDMDSDKFNDLNDICLTKIRPHETALWIVVGEKRRVVADMLATKIITIDVCMNFCPDYKSYIVTGYPSVLNWTLNIIHDLRSCWFLYLHDWDDTITGQNPEIIRTLILDRCNMAKNEFPRGRPTIVTVNNDNAAFQKIRDTKRWDNTIKVIQTKE